MTPGIMFGYALDDGTVGVYDVPERKWFVHRSKVTAICGIECVIMLYHCYIGIKMSLCDQVFLIPARIFVIYLECFQT